MYRSIYLPLDNSAHSLRGLDIAMHVAGATGARLTGSHVYAAKLHDRRFRQMEGGLPEPYRKEEKLVEQRDIHDDLITRGLRIISDSYLDVFEGRCHAAGLAGRSVSLEGKNWQELAKDISAGDYDLVVMGALGLGAVESSQLGSVCERVARRIDRDLWVVRDPEERAEGAIVVALDGSPQSYGGLMTAFELGRITRRPVEAVATFDPDFHYVAFNSIAKVLSAEAASVFRFQEQERLHEEIIDSGLARIYQGHLDVATRIAREQGVEIATRLLAGKPFEQLLRHARETSPWLLVMGRIGVHSEPGMDLGSATENLLRLCPCNLLLSARCFTPALDHIADATMAWTDEAESRMARVPEFVRGMARKAVLQHAAERGHTVVTSDVIDACLQAIMPPGAQEAMAGASGSGKCPFRHDSAGPGIDGEKAFDGVPVAWEPAALARIARISDATLREHARLRMEKMARRQGLALITEALVDAGARAVTEVLTQP
jgi:nucleotide-binding universal stress UspA family protein